MDPARAAEIKGREDAIKRKLDVKNNANRTTALKSINSAKGGTATYGTQVISGPNTGTGYSKSDYGAGTGAAIPYRIENSAGTVSKAKPKPPSPPKPSPVASGGHTSYKVQKGDTLSGIAKKTGSTVDAIWNYNLKNRSTKTQKILKTRGKNLIYRGGTFYIPK